MNNLNVFIYDKQIFTSPNAATLPRPPIHKTAKDYTSPSAARTLRWSSNTYPQLGYVPVSSHFHGPLLERLAFSQQNLPIVKNGEQWQLSPPIQWAWQRLEIELIYVANVLVEKSTFAFPIQYPFPPLPSRWGYLGSHRLEKYARACALCSRDAFLLLLGHCSFAISLHGANFDELTPAWAQILVGELGLHPVWVDQLKNSPVGNFSENSKRVGVFVHVGECQWLHLIPSLLRACVPIYFYWGEVDGNRLPASFHVKPYRPTSEQIAAAVERAGAHSLDWIQPWASRSAPQDPVLRPTPPSEQHHSTEPERGSRQMRGETWQRFFTRQETRQSEYLARESAVQRQLRQDRAKAFRNCPEPGRCGPVVYRWEDVGGFRIRTRMNRGAVGDWWAQYSNNQKIYNSCEDEWDVCTEFDPDGHPEIDDDDLDFVDIDIQPGTPPPPPYGSQSQPPPPPQSLWHDDLAAIYDHDIQAICHPYDYNETLDTLLHNRFGFTTPPERHNQIEGATVNPRPLEWKDVLKLLGDSQSPIDSHLKDDVCYFLTCLLENGRAPGLLWDLSDCSHRPLRHGVDDLFQLTIKISCSGETFYAIKPVHPNRHTRWELVLQDAVTVLECCRRQWVPDGDSDDIARHLVKRGMAFSTRVPPPPTAYPPPPHYSHPPIGLGWRYPQYKPDAVDYAAYECARDALLRQPHARAALLKGGIIWRLAREHIDYSSNAVLSGPSEYVYHCGHALRFSDGQVSWDDDLSEQEMDLICGVYKVYTGMCPTIVCELF